MALKWIRDVDLQLRASYSLWDSQGQEVKRVQRGLVAFDGGFAYIHLAGTNEVQVVPAAAVWRATYPAKMRRVHRPRTRADHAST